MSSGLTPIFSLPYPLSTDGVDVHGDMEDLALKVEEILSIKSNTNTANTFTGINNFLVNSSSPAIRITQTGSGPALLVEDQASVDSTPFIIDATGKVGIGTALPGYALHVVADDVKFEAASYFEGPTFVGVDDSSSTILTVFGSMFARDAIQADALISTSRIIYKDTATDRDINILLPAGGVTAVRDMTLPDVSGTIITSGNPNDLYPSQTSNAGKVLSTNGASVSWIVSPNQVPATAGQTGKWLTTDGSTYYWENLLLIPELDITEGTGSTGKWLTNDGEEVYWDFLPGQEPFIEVSNDIVLEVGANLFCDTRNGNFSITLPDNPLPGSTVSVFDVQNFFQSEYVIIEPGTEKINGIEGNLILDVGGATVVFIYINETIGWRVA